MRYHAILLTAALLTACGGPSRQPAPNAAASAEQLPTTPQIPPVEFGKRPPGTRITSDNMPYFDTVKYCEWATRGKETRPRGPLYERCIDDQSSTHEILAKSIDARKFTDKKIEHCAKATRSAYHGMWYCLWDQPFR